ncbi:MAG: hypothetical protein HWN68_09850 [Desulfobacterales bacterium]|nr:hypothetical protein [Desulfobacterales bacterium]
MLTVFSVPKPFLGHIGIIQRNAIQSWACLDHGCEIILCGDEPGTEEAAAENKARYIPGVARNEYGTPLLNSVFAEVRQIANHPLLCYVNADIILLRDFIEAAQRIGLPRFLGVGQRWDLEITEPWDFDRSDWEHQLSRYVAEHGVLHPPLGSDYFVFLRDDTLGELPPFAVGRPGWDNWFIYRARKLGVPVVDLSRVVTVIHQNHGYSHVANWRVETSWDGPEADWNRRLVGGWAHVFTLLDVTHVMTNETLLPAREFKYLRRRWQTLPILSPVASPFVWLVNLAARCFGSLRRLLSSKRVNPFVF